MTGRYDVSGVMTTARSYLYHLLGFAALFLFLGWLYYPALDSYFANDDWVILYHNSQVSPWQPWLYFNPKTVWFYRPLQSMQFGLTWQVAGLNHVAYCVQLLVMHLAVCVLGWLFLRRLFSAGLAWCAVVLFSVTWIYADILLWKANINTIQHAIFSLLASYFFVRYLDTRRTRWQVAVVVAAVLNCLTKESCVSLPLILGTVWLTRYLQGLWGEREYTVERGWKWFVSDGWRCLWPAGVVTIVYVGLHTAFVENVEPNYKPGYVFVPPLEMLAQWSHATNYSLFSFTYDPLLLGLWSPLKAGLLWVLKYGYILPAVVFCYGIFKRQPFVVFALLFTMVALFPTFALSVYHASRYYYLSAFGGAVLIGGVVYSALRQVQSGGRVWAYAAVIFFIWTIAGHVILFQQIIGRDYQESLVMQQTADYLKEAGPRIPKESVIVFQNVPLTFMSEGMGATEMVSMLTHREDIIALSMQESLTDIKREAIDARPGHYLLDVMTTSPVFQTINR